MKGVAISEPSVDTSIIPSDILPGGDLLLLHEESTLFGGSGGEQGHIILVDDSDTTYLIGTTDSDDLPLVNPFVSIRSGTMPFITVFNSDKSIIYSTFFGGSGQDYITSATFDDQGNLLVVGSTNSPNFPITSDALNNSYSSSAAFLTIISPNGTVLYSSFFGGSGSDAFYDVVFDDAIYLTGYSSSVDFPITDNAFSGHQGSWDMVLTILNKYDYTVQYSTYFGGSSSERGEYIAKEGNQLFITGDSDSADFPEINETGYKIDSPDIVLLKFDLQKMNVTFSSYFGSDYFQSVGGLAFHGDSIYLAGSTEYPIYGLSSPLLQLSYYDGFILCINSSSMEIASGTYIGGSGVEEILSLAITDEGDIIFTGTTSSSDFPIFGLLEDQILNTDVGTEIFIGIMSPDLSRVRYLDAFGYMHTERTFSIYTKNNMLYMIGSAFLDDIIEPSFELVPGGGIIDVFYAAVEIGDIYPEFDDISNIQYARSNQQYSFNSTGTHRILNATYEWQLEPGKNGSLINSSLTTPVGEGYHYLKLYPLLDFNQIITNFCTFYIDDTDPMIQILEHESFGDVETNSKLQFIITDDTLYEVSYSLNGEAFTTLYEPFTIQVPDETGALNLEIKAVDKAGNEGNKMYNFMIVDPEPTSTPTEYVTQYETETEIQTVTASPTDTVTTTVISTVNPGFIDSQTDESRFPFSLLITFVVLPVVMRFLMKRSKK